MNHLRSLMIYSKTEFINNFNRFIEAEYNIQTQNYCLLEHLPGHRVLNSYNLIILITHEITADAIQKLSGINAQVFLWLIDDNAHNIQPARQLLHFLRPQQSDKFFKQLIVCNEIVIAIDKKDHADVNQKRLKIFDSHHGHHQIELDNVVILNSSGSYTNIFTTTKKFLNQTHNLKYYTDKLNQDFYRINNSHIINAKHIVDYSKKNEPYIIMPNNYKIKVTKNYKETLDKIINKHHL